MWSLLDLVAADLAPEPAASGGDIAGLIVLVLFVGFFVVFGFLALRKKRIERIETLTRELERPGLSTDVVPGPGPETPAEPVGPKASELVAAEREALLRRAEADAAARAAARAAEIAAATADVEEKQKALAAEKAALEKAAAAKAAKDKAEEQARTLRLALGRTRDGIMGRLSTALGGKTIDAAVLDDIESVLFTADIGVRTAERMLQAVKGRLSRKELSSLDKVQETLKAEATAILAGVEPKPLALEGPGPRVVLVLGVNGAGKTTTIGKLAAQLKAQGKSVLLGAGDTFRAAAADQLEVWAKRADVPIVTGPDGGDPSSVLFDTI
jgi:fused signal recognition particle receptor